MTINVQKTTNYLLTISVDKRVSIIGLFVVLLVELTRLSLEDINILRVLIPSRPDWALG